MQADVQNDFRVIVGLGKTGFACARFLGNHKIPFAVTDSRMDPPYLAQFQTDFPQARIKVGGFDKDLLQQATELIISPGISLKEPLIAERLAAGIPCVGDIELFARYAKAPICAITGSNAKSTVTALVHSMAQTAKLNVKIGGNFGIPALDLIDTHEPDFYVIELSSFQLETTYSLHALASSILNISPDHMDRYNHLDDYVAAKQRIYNNTTFAIINREDKQTHVHSATVKEVITFGLSKPNQGEFGLIKEGEGIFLAYGPEKLIAAKDVGLKGKHNWVNALAALALGSAMRIPMHAMVDTLKSFSGLPHRCQWVAEKNGVDWYNDSKGTNVGAAVAAIEGLGSAITGKITLIAGGLGKEADFSLLAEPVKKYVSQVILIGKDAPMIADALHEQTQLVFAETMSEAILIAAKTTQLGGCVLLSPACASFDMFRNYEHRGEVFMQWVRELV